MVFVRALEYSSDLDSTRSRENGGGCKSRIVVHPINDIINRPFLSHCAKTHSPCRYTSWLHGILPGVWYWVFAHPQQYCFQTTDHRYEFVSLECTSRYLAHICIISIYHDASSIVPSLRCVYVINMTGSSDIMTSISEYPDHLYESGV